MPSAVTVWDDATVLGLISGCRCTGGCFHAGRHMQKKWAQEGFKWANSNTPAIIQHGKGWTAESPIPGMTRLHFKPPCSESWSKWCTVNSRDAEHRGINSRCTVKCSVLIPCSGEAMSPSITFGNPSTSLQSGCETMQTTVFLRIWKQKLRMSVVDDLLHGLFVVLGMVTGPAPGMGTGDLPLASPWQ